MKIRFDEHALERMQERGTTEDEVKAAIFEGKRFQAKQGRIGFRRTFCSETEWEGIICSAKQLEVIVAKKEEGWLVITVIVKYIMAGEL